MSVFTVTTGFYGLNFRIRMTINEVDIVNSEHMLYIAIILVISGQKGKNEIMEHIQNLISSLYILLILYIHVT